MGRYIGPVCRLCRRERSKLYLKGARCYGSKCPVDRKLVLPGQHGPKQGLRGKMGDYNIHLREKQKVKRMYGVFENAFEKYFVSAKGQREIPTGEKLMELLERRLDNVVFRASMAQSRTIARQIVNHGHVKVNGKRLDVPSYQVRPGDKIEIKEQARSFDIIADSIKSPLTPPSWLSLDSKNFKVEVLRVPTMSDIDINANVQLIVEFYSR